MSVTEAVGITGLKPHQVRPALKRLLSFGLAEIDRGSGPKGGDLYRCIDVSTDHLDRLATELGIIQDRELKAERVKRQRDAWKAKRAKENR